MTHRRALHGLVRPQFRTKAERPKVAGEVSQPPRSRKIPQVFEEPRPVGPVGQLLVLVGCDAGGDDFLGLARVVNGRDQAVTGGGEGAGALDDLL